MKVKCWKIFVSRVASLTVAACWIPCFLDFCCYDEQLFHLVFDSVQLEELTFFYFQTIAMNHYCSNMLLYNREQLISILKAQIAPELWPPNLRQKGENVTSWIHSRERRKFIAFFPSVIMDKDLPAPTLTLIVMGNFPLRPSLSSKLRWNRNKFKFSSEKLY